MRALFATLRQGMDLCSCKVLANQTVAVVLRQSRGLPPLLLLAIKTSVLVDTPRLPVPRAWLQVGHTGRTGSYPQNPVQHTTGGRVRWDPIPSREAGKSSSWAMEGFYIATATRTRPTPLQSFPSRAATTPCSNVRQQNQV